jgi:hypothetical protein
MCDRPAHSNEVALKEIEITPEMIEAGVSILLAADYRFESHEDVVKDILTAAKMARLVAKHC